MLHVDAASAECLVFTYKEGLLSPVAHDLKLRVSRFTVDIDPVSLTVAARFDARSLEVVCARQDGRDRPGALSDADKRQIEHTLAADVLEVARYPEVRFESTSVAPEGDGYRVAGQLTLHGVTRPITFTTTPLAEQHVAEVTLDQPDFAIKPYRAMLGALKVRRDVTVRVVLRASDMKLAG
jgi:polyisoprenoid-binding protein YceI